MARRNRRGLRNSTAEQVAEAVPKFVGERHVRIVVLCSAHRRDALRCASVPQCPPRLTANGSSPRTDATSTAAALAGTARPSHRPAPDRMSPSPRSPHSAPRVPRPGSALPDLRGRQPSGSRTACRQLPRTRAPSREASGRSPRLEGVAPRPRRAACTRLQNEERLLIRLGVIDAALARLEDGHIDPELRELHRRVAVLVREPARRAPRLRSEPLGIAHVDDEPALGDGGEPGASVLKPRFGQEPDSRSPSDTSLTCASVRECPLSNTCARLAVSETVREGRGKAASARGRPSARAPRRRPPDRLAA